MFQFSVLIFLSASIFVGSVYPIPAKEGYDSGAAVLAVNATNTSGALINNSTHGAEPVKQLTEEVTEPPKSSKTSTTVVRSEHLLAGNETTAVPEGHQRHKHICTNSTEQFDMINCFVTPHDDDELVDPSRFNSTAPTTLTIVTSDGLHSNDTSVIKGVVAEDEKKLNETIYEPVPPHENPKNSSSPDASDAQPKRGTNYTDTVISSVAPLLADNARSIEEEESAKESRDRSMPSGIIALVTAIVFAIALVVVYISMIAWRRYLEYRYEHRELLVNDLEFDTNDLRHFEL